MTMNFFLISIYEYDDEQGTTSYEYEMWGYMVTCGGDGAIFLITFFKAWQGAIFVTKIV